jgi:hypothetical protein
LRLFTDCKAMSGPGVLFTQRVSTPCATSLATSLMASICEFSLEAAWRVLWTETNQEVIMENHIRNDSHDVRASDYLARVILAYLAEHPQAMDTIEGIAEWWIRRQEVRTLVENVTEIVQRLTQAGVLEEIGTGPGSRFRLARPAETAGPRQSDFP